MAVPDTNTFTMLNVVREVGGGDVSAYSSLQEVFNDAVAGDFDATYEGSKDRLSNFRNYTNSSDTVNQGTLDPIQVRLAYSSLSYQDACVKFYLGDLRQYTIRSTDSTLASAQSINDYTDTVPAQSGYYSDGNNSRQYQGGKFVGSVTGCEFVSGDEIQQ